MCINIFFIRVIQRVSFFEYIIPTIDLDENLYIW